MNMNNRFAISMLMIVVLLAPIAGAQAPDFTGTDSSVPAPPYEKKSKVQLRKVLSPEQYAVTQRADTERAFSGQYWNHKADGVYTCVVCQLPLFDSAAKFESGTGWPSYYAPLTAKHLGTHVDRKLGYPRTEVHCERCGAHLGHVFNDGPQPTGLRFCINSASLKFIERAAYDELKKSAPVEEAR